MATIIDRNRLMEHLEGDLELLEDAFDLFREESQSSKDRLRAAFESRDIESVHRIAHSIKGMLANFLAESACETTERIQSIADPQVLADSYELLDTLAEQMDRTLDELREILASEPKP